MIVVSTTSSDRDSENDKTTDVSPAVQSKKDIKFWLIFASMSICLFLSALELSSISTALPTIAHELQASQFGWVGSAYALSSTAFLPMSWWPGPSIRGICGGATSMNVLIAGRTIQGLGGGERGVYAGLFGLTWCLAAAIGPVVGGSLAAQGKWRWLFYLNLPISLIGSLSVILFLDLPTPPGNYQDKLRRMNWIGNFLVVASTVAYTIGLTWGGATAPWGSATVLVPLVLGLVGLVVFISYEATIASHPLVPLALMMNTTSISGYIQSFCIALNMFAVVYFFPVYFQACKGDSPVVSGVYTLSLCTFAPAAIFAGLSVKATGRYRPQMWVAWVIVLTAMGLLSAPTMNAMGRGVGMSLGYLALLGLGIGALYATTMYPIQAPLSVTQNASALAWMWFLRSFAGVWGVTIGSAILQNELSKTLPVSFIQSLPPGTAVPTLYALIPDFSTLPPHTRAEVQVAFARSLTVLWQVLAVVCAVGGVASLFMRGLELSHTLDATWAIRNSDGVLDQEAAMTRQMEG
ncbi:major facilitator superfamily domain-containing protein [Boletus coccyginus]|nr:major facilitator superfamily domain-containing protein [Boletus coccyginus]